MKTADVHSDGNYDNTFFMTLGPAALSQLPHGGRR